MRPTLQKALLMRYILPSLIILLNVLNTAKADDSMMFSELAFPDTNGTTINMTDFKGKIVLLNFWATWCPPCVKEMPSMQRLKNHFADQPFEIVAISAGEESEAVTEFLPRLNTEFTFPILVDAKGISFMALGIKGLPMSFLLNKDGKSILTIMGGREWDDETQIKLIENALAGKPLQ